MLDPYKYPLSFLLEVALVSAPTFASWQQRYELLPRANTDRTWRLYSVAELCVARTMVVQVNNGVSAAVAAKIAMQTRPFFKNVCEVDGAGMISNNIYLFSDDRVRIADMDDQFANVVKGTAFREDAATADLPIGECAVLLNLGQVILHVMLMIGNLSREKPVKLDGGAESKAHASFSRADVLKQMQADLADIQREIDNRLKGEKPRSKRGKAGLRHAD